MRSPLPLTRPALDTLQVPGIKGHVRQGRTAENHDPQGSDQLSSPPKVFDADFLNTPHRFFRSGRGPAASIERDVLVRMASRVSATQPHPGRTARPDSMSQARLLWSLSIPVCKMFE